MTREEKVNRLIQSLSQTFSVYDNASKSTRQYPILSEEQRNDIVGKISTELQADEGEISEARMIDIINNLLTMNSVTYGDKGEQYYGSLVTGTTRDELTQQYYNLLSAL